MGVIITTDSSSDLSEEQIKSNGIRVLPLYVNLNGDEYKDGINITPDKIFAFVKGNKKLPKTSAISEEDYENFFAEILGENVNNTIVHVGLSSGLSTSYNNSINAAEKFNGKVKIVDGKNLSSGTGLLVLFAARLRDKGLSHEEIAKRVEPRVKNVQASFIIQEVEYLYRGGRCSALALLGANLLRIKPRIQVINGVMQLVGKPRGKMEVVLKKYIDDVLKEYNNPDKTICFVTHSCLEKDIVDKIVEYVKSKNIFDSVVETIASSTITSHCGKGTLGILYINDGGETNEKTN